MIIINEHADYSANAIGQLAELSDLAKAYLSKYSKVLNTNQKVAFGNFIDTLDNNGVLDKITDMWLPCLASNVTEAIYNAKADVAGVITKDASLIYRLNDNGLYGAEWDGSNVYSLDDQPIHRPNTTDTQHLFVDYLLGSTRDTLGCFRENYIFTDSGPFKWVFGSSDANNISSTPAISLSVGNRYVKNVNVIGRGTGTDGIFVFGTDYLSVKHNGEDAILSETGTVTTRPSAINYDIIRLGSYVISQYNNNTASPVALEIYAFGLNETEIGIVNNAIMLFNSLFFI